jgi:hypothetical protein
VYIVGLEVVLALLAVVWSRVSSLLAFPGTSGGVVISDACSGGRTGG